MIGESGDEEWNEFVELAAMHQDDQIPGVDDGIDQQGMSIPLVNDRQEHVAEVAMGLSSCSSVR